MVTTTPTLANDFGLPSIDSVAVPGLSPITVGCRRSCEPDAPAFTTRATAVLSDSNRSTLCALSRPMSSPSVMARSRVVW